MKEKRNSWVAPIWCVGRRKATVWYAPHPSRTGVYFGRPIFGFHPQLVLGRLNLPCSGVSIFLYYYFQPFLSFHFFVPSYVFFHFLFLFSHLYSFFTRDSLLNSWTFFELIKFCKIHEYILNSWLFFWIQIFFWNQQFVNSRRFLELTKKFEFENIFWNLIIVRNP